MVKKLTQLLCMCVILLCNALYANEQLNNLYYKFSTQKMPELFDSIQSALNESPELSQTAKVKELAQVAKTAYRTWYKSLERLNKGESTKAAELIRENISIVYFEKKIDDFLDSKSHMISWEIPLYQQVINILLGTWGGAFFENESLSEVRKEFYHLFTCDEHDCVKIAEDFSSEESELQTHAIQKYFECKKKKGLLYGPHLAELCELINNDNFDKVTYFV
ncbi:hypothetical protein [Endozoicomonas sp. 4G]|uniref:hypothetical protein n=1 Tax=Endozoicomonas sp. 4G TaxID=2872754 RepID=UPI002078D35D|nr:hypothetical protein [Endozoicomonas sp. 4G]